MSKIAKYILLSLSLSLFSITCLAADHGRYLCKECTHPMNPIDISAFVRVFVNRDVNRWQANDTFSICNGSICVKYMTPHAEAAVWQAIMTMPDPGHGYRRTGEPVANYAPYGLDPFDFINDFLDGWYRVSFGPYGNVIVEDIEWPCDDESVRNGRYEQIGACP